LPKKEDGSNCADEPGPGDAFTTGNAVPRATAKAAIWLIFAGGGGPISGT